MLELATRLTLALWFVEAIVFLLAVAAWRSRRVQERIEARVAPLREIRRAGVVPFRIKYKAVSQPDWIDVEKVERLSESLRERGFVEHGTWEVEPFGILERIHYHPELGVAGVVAEGSLPLEVWGELCTRYPDGTTFCYTGARFAGVADQPPFRTVVEFHHDDISQLVDEFIAERPAKPVLHCPWDQIAAWGEESYRREMDWRIERGGMTEDEIRRAAEAGGGEATAELIASIRERYRVAIENFRREPPPENTDPPSMADAAERPIARTRTPGMAAMLQFTIREWALICIIVGLAVGWGLDHWSTEMTAKRREAQVQEMMLQFSKQLLRDRFPATGRGGGGPE